MPSPATSVDIPTPVYHPAAWQTLLTGRWFYLLSFLVVASLFSFALYLQYVENLEPCPLCMSQRIALIAMGIMIICGLALPSMIGTDGRLHRSHSNLAWLQVFVTVLALLFAAVGAALATRQLWLQSLPPELVPACGPGLNYMLEVFPMSEVLSMMLHGSGECAEVHWRFLGLSIPGWTLIMFVGFGLAFAARLIATMVLKTYLGKLHAEVSTSKQSTLK